MSVDAQYPSLGS